MYAHKYTHLWTSHYINMYAILGKLKLSCDVIVVNNFPHQVIVFE